MYLCKKYKCTIMSKTTQNKKSVTWQYKGKKDLVIPVNLSPYEALRLVGVPFNPHTQSGYIRPQNASYGVKNSFHKRPWRGSKRYGSAVDLTPAPGYTYDDILRALAHPALQAWAKANGYGILDERPASVRKRTNATGPHLHFGPDRGATKIYANPLIAPHYSYWKSLGMKTPEYNGAEVRYNNTQGNINVNTPVTVSNNSMQYLPLELIQTPLLQPVYIPAQQQVNGFDLTYNNYDWSNLFDSAPQKSNLLDHVLPQYNYEYSNNINLLAPFLFSDIQGNSSISEPEEKKLKIRFAADGGFVNTFKDGGKPVSFNSIADMIKAHEGFKATPYKDGRNKKTGEQWYSVGYGFNDSGIHHNIGKKYIGKQMTRKEADNLLQGYITHLQGTLKKTLGNKIYNSLTPGQMMAYIDTGYQRPATMINAAKLHRKTGNINNVANALAVKGYDKRNANRRNAFLGNISINQQSVPEYQEVIQPVQIPQMQQVIYQQPIVPIPTDIPESSIVEDYNYLNNDEYTEGIQKPNMAIVSANPELYGEQFSNAEFLKAMFEPLGVNNNQIKNVENKKLQFKHISAEGGALVIDNGNNLVDNQDWDSYIQQKFSEYKNYQIVPDLTEEEIQRESNGIPLYAKGGKVNIFDGYGSSYIPQGYEQYVYEPKTINGIEYAKLPKSYTNTDIKVSNLEGKTTDDYEYVFVRKDPKTNRYQNTQYDRDISNINIYRSGKYPELTTWDKNAPAASAYNANSELNRDNITHQLYWDPVNKQIRDKQLTQYLNQRLLTNEDAAKYLIYGLGALGIASGVGAAPGTTLLSLAGGMGGAYATDRVSQKINGNTWAQNMSNWTGLPEWVTEITNPGGLIGGITGGLSGDYFNGVQNRLNYMLLNTTDKHSPIEPLAKSVKQAITGFDLGRTKARLNYLFRNKEPNSVPLYTDFIVGRSNGMNQPYVGDEYWASFRTPTIIKNDPSIQKYYGKDVIYAVPSDRFMSKMPISKGEVKHSLIFGEDLDPNIFKYIGGGEQNFGVHANYIKTHPQYKYSKVYEIDTGNGRGFTPSNDWVQDKIKDGSVVDKKVFGTDSSYYQKSSFDNSSVRSATGRDYKYDGAGNLLEVLKIKQPNGRMLYAARRQDIYKFNAKDYSKKWGIKDVFQNLGLRHFDKVTAENVPIVRTNWRVYDNPNDLIQDFKFGVEEDNGAKSLDSFMQFLHK